MDERAQAILDEAFAHIERADAERDDLRQELVQREADGLLLVQPVRRRQRKASRTITEDLTMPEAAPAMDKDTLARWEAWANTLVQAKLADFASILGDLAAEQERRLLTQFAGELKRLDDKIATLEAELDTLRGNNARNITPFRSAHG